MVDQHENNKSAQAYYDQVTATGEYHEIYDQPVCHAEDLFVQHATQQQLHGHVLDVGCGDGLLFNILTHQPHPLFKTYNGIDISDKLLLDAMHKYPHVPVVHADMHQLPYPDEMFDNVASIFGPFSYSLAPNTLLDEFDRVLQPDGSLFIMPYTLRTGHAIELGGTSTAIEPSIQKIFYTSDLAHQTFNRYHHTVRGLNYFANTIPHLLQDAVITSDDITPQVFVDLLEAWADEMNIAPPATDPALFNKLAVEWKRTPEIPDTEDFVRLLAAEAEIADIIPAEFARHMYVQATRRN